MNKYYRLALGICIASIVVALLFAIENTNLLILVVAIAGVLGCLMKMERLAKEKFNFYEQILDTIPNPLSVTDMDMKWTFVNRAATDPLGVKRGDVLGMHCSNWGANICNTEDCGVNCLRKGKQTTSFHQWDKYFRVDTFYINGLNGNKIGHVEYVQEISEKVALKSVYKDVDAISENLTLGAKNLNDASHALTVGSTQQAASVTQIGSSLNEILTQANDNAERASRASAVSTEAQRAATMASDEIRELEQAMQEINRSSDAISEIINVIDDIASQTNLLALNASIEAARAGEMGRGFAVVADEVRKLAERSSTAASESAEYIQISVGNIEKGNAISQKCVSALGEIVKHVATITDTIEEIDNASQSQATGLSQVNQGMSEIDEVVHSTATSAEETSISASELSELSLKLQAQLEKMRKIDGLIDNTAQTDSNMIEVKNVS
ncbi:methyl-accepting chemotaxis sensory transducer with Pas/Pac sensor [Vibrio gazogenes DSM 21264]|uniref:Methyl-accepting chemotaxis sensory transducer with Pas/Pac sensor n=1 Tax=Vibrio gazogenes DSM 21264 = NBRC 103151 TaxID=1123492 RepID=A0A1M5A9V7_VIBGA|nr:methyl-accepting chemotaxis protein [Vibrio gazogenes]USP13298.1 methyl-accepting chemotaxis protein [Vibrio gazogenes]SHF26934.1 methyl-accepting chemotaxis sensory transducer with Pas/Pac sensor [Vibrio gazogenes DSM 21264] [Vibrio gazogenes DSM 21264 = NBRC 103151]